jgi:hypothetical protein
MIVGPDWGHSPYQGDRRRSRHGAAGGESEGFRTSHPLLGSGYSEVTIQLTTRHGMPGPRLAV